MEALLLVLIWVGVVNFWAFIFGVFFMGELPPITRNTRLVSFLYTTGLTVWSLVLLIKQGA